MCRPGGLRKWKFFGKHENNCPHCLMIKYSTGNDVIPNKHRKNCKSCTTNMSWKVKVSCCPVCPIYTLCPVCPVCSVSPVLVAKYISK